MSGYSLSTSRLNSRSGSRYVPRSVRIKEKNTKKRLIFNIVIGIAVLYFLLTWGLPNLIGSLSGLHKPKPSSDQSVINSGILAPPVLNIPFDATNSSTLVITGYAVPNSQVEIFVNDSQRTTVPVEDNGSFQTSPILLDDGTNNIYGKTLNSTKQESLPSKGIELTYSNEKPQLQVNQPADGTQIKGGDKKVTVSGTTDPNDTVTINNVTAIVGQDGSFSGVVPLNDGDNTITIISTNDVGNTSTVTLHVNYSES